MQKALKPYDFHGVEFDTVSRGDEEAKGICPFCRYHRKVFHVNVESGQYHCKHCGDNGNTFTFLQRVLDTHAAATSKDDYKELADDRTGIPWTAFRDHGFAVQRNGSGNPRWLIPVRNPRGTTVSTRVYRYGQRVMGTGGLPLHLWRLEHYKGKGPIYLCEGEWDSLALERLRKKAKKPGIVLCVPGANVFKNEWSHFFVGRDVYICFDSDGEGAEGSERVAQILQAHARSIHILHWPPDTEEGWDIRDTVHWELDEEGGDAETVWEELHRLFQIPAHLMSLQETSPVPVEELPVRTSFRTVLTDYKNAYFLDKNMRDAVAIIYATALSIRLPDDPIWMFLAGPPGTGKTMLLSSLRLTEWAVFKSSLTPKSLISGFITESGEDPSLLAKLMGKVLILKDYTETITMNREAQEEVHGILRGAYDGYAEKTFGNGLTRCYPDCNFAMIAGVTNVIHGDERASLGERFLKYQMAPEGTATSSDHILAAISSMAQQTESEKHLQRVAASFLNSFPVEDFSAPQPDQTMLRKIVAISHVVSHLRAEVKRTGRDELVYRPSPERGTRIGKQLTKLIGCLAVVLGKKQVDKECWRLARRVALDTVIGWNLDIFLEVARHKGGLVTRADIMHNARVAGTTCTRHLENMRIIGTLVSERIKKPGPGKPSHGWRLSDEIQTLWNLISQN